MSKFIELTDAYTKERVMINTDNIAVIEEGKSGTNINFVGLQGIGTVQETYEEIKEMINGNHNKKLKEESK